MSTYVDNIENDPTVPEDQKAGMYPGMAELLAAERHNLDIDPDRYQKGYEPMTTPIFGITEYGDAGLDQSWRERMHEVHGAIIITKAPHLLLQQEMPSNTIIHCTITGMAGSLLEPNTAPLDVTIAAYTSLVTLYGYNRVVLRVDPIIPTERGFQTAMQVLQHAKGRVRISFMDAYNHVRVRIQAATGRDLPWKGFHAPLDARKLLAQRILDETHIASLEICGEPGMDCTGCISDLDLKVLGMDCKLTGICRQRSTCACKVDKKIQLIGGRKRCANLCAYCFWKD